MSKEPAALRAPEALPLQAMRGVVTRLAPDAGRPAESETGERRYRVLFSAAAEVERMRWTGWDSVERFIEELVVTDESVDMSRLNGGGIPFLKDHRSYTIDAVLGRCTTGSVDGGKAYCDVILPRAGTDPEIDRIASMIEQDMLTDVSVGYSIDQVRIVESEKRGEKPRHIVERWTPMEVSLVAIPADAGARVQRSGEEAGAAPLFPVQFIRSATPETPPARRSDNQEKDTMSNANKAGDPAETIDTAQAQRAAAPVTAPPAPAPAGLTAREAIELRTQAVAIGLDAAKAEEIVQRDGVTPTAAREAILAAAAAASAAQPRQDGRIQIVRDEGTTLRERRAEAIVLRMTGGDLGEAHRDLAQDGFIDFAAALIGHRGKLRTAGERLQVLERAFHSVSDFPIIYENILNKTLTARYAVAVPTYRRFAVKKNFKDFRPHVAVRTGDFPMLQPIGENGEIRFGTSSEKKEQSALASYAVGIAISRQMLVDDDLGSIADILSNQGGMVATFEERAFYAFMRSGAGNNGPTLLEGNTQMFATSAARGNLASAGSAIDVASVSAARAALRKMKSLPTTVNGVTQPGQNLNITATVILTGPDRETQAQQLIAPIQPAQASNVNIFSGRLSNEVTAEIPDNSWYLLPEASVGSNFRYGYLEGAEQPRVRLENPFGRQGSQVSIEHDFGIGAEDYRFAWRNPGA